MKFGAIRRIGVPLSYPSRSTAPLCIALATKMTPSSPGAIADRCLRSAGPSLSLGKSDAKKQEDPSQERFGAVLLRHICAGDYARDGAIFPGLKECHLGTSRRKGRC